MNDLAHIVGIYRTLRNATQVDGVTEGYLDVQDEPMRLFLLDIEKDSRSDEVGLAILSEPGDIKVGFDVPIRLFQPKSLPIYHNLAAYLGNGSRLLEPIGDFYLIKENRFSAEPEARAEIRNLDAFHHVLNQLCDAATVVDKDKARLHFADSVGLVDLPINVSPADLKAVTPEVADDFFAFCSDSLHRQHRLEAVAKVVIRQTRGISANDRLQYVLHNLNSILSDAKSQHAVFLSAFSYEKVRDEVEALKVEYTSRIHKVLSDIQGQLLGIPVATVVVATQMKKTATVGSVFVVNTAVLVGAFIFSSFLILLIGNQRNTLSMVKEEINRQGHQLKSELPEAADRFDETFNLLEKRARHQRGILIAVIVGVVLGFIVSCFAYWMLSSTPIKTILRIIVVHTVKFIKNINNYT